MFGKANPQVLIAGAGPVGLFAGVALAVRGVRVQVVDTGLWPCARSYALALHSRSLDLLERYGLKQAALEAAYPVQTLAFYDERGPRVRIPAGPAEGQAIPVLRQDVFEKLLERRLAEAGVQVHWRHAVAKLEQNDAGVTATIEKYEQESRGYVVAHSEWVVTKSAAIETPFVVGADGYNSRVRRAAKLEFPEVGSPEYFAVFEFESDYDLNHEMRVVLTDGATSVLWPLPGGKCRWSFGLPGYMAAAPELKAQLGAGPGQMPSKRAKERLDAQESWDSPILDEAGLRDLIARRAPWFTGSVDDVSWRTVIRFEHRLASGFGNGRLWIGGDAAHLTGPVGVRSMNAGLAEAEELAEALAGVLCKGESGDALKRYDEHWTAEWRRLHGVEGGAAAGAHADAWVAANAAAIAACIPAYGADLTTLANRLALTL